MKFHIDDIALEVDLIHYLFSGLFDSLVIDLHLLRKVFLQPFILVYLVVDELYRNLNIDFNGGFTILTVVEPGFSPPFQS